MHFHFQIELYSFFFTIVHVFFVTPLIVVFVAHIFDKIFHQGSPACKAQIWEDILQKFDSELLNYSMSCPSNPLRAVIDSLREELEEKEHQIVRLQDEVERWHRFLQPKPADREAAGSSGWSQSNRIFFVLIVFLATLILAKKILFESQLFWRRYAHLINQCVKCNIRSLQSRTFAKSLIVLPPFCKKFNSFEKTSVC